MPCTAKMDFREICRPYLSHQQKDICPKYLKNESTEINAL